MGIMAMKWQTCLWGRVLNKRSMIVLVYQSQRNSE